MGITRPKTNIDRFPSVLRDNRSAFYNFSYSRKVAPMSTPKRILRLVVSLAGIGGVVAVCASIPHIHAATVVLVLLLTILAIANRWGFVEATVATCLGAVLLAYAFLLPSRRAIEPTERWVVFLTFVTVALLASHMAVRAKLRAEDAVTRRRELERLYAFGRDLPIGGDTTSIVAKGLDSLIAVFQAEAAAFYDHRTQVVTRAGPKANAFSDALFSQPVSSSEIYTDEATGCLLALIRCRNLAVGTIAVRGGAMSELTLRAVADRIEVTLERVWAYEDLRRAEETKRNQELKTALLDSLVHEIKTPLSVIKTAVSSLLSRDSDALGRREFLTIINEEADRLDASISEVFWKARLEAGTLQSGKGPHDIRPLVDETLSELRPLLGNRSVRIKIPEVLPPATCDSSMIKGVVKELLTNALKYSPADSPLTIAVRQIGEEIVTSVTDVGIGIRPGEEKRIFEKHYRGSVLAPGSGLGLALAKTIVEAHGGNIGVDCKRVVGSEFHFSLPVSHQDVA
jgi:two-component system sensor histidine kinase KdpD